MSNTTNPTVHPNAWTETHSDSCPICRVCPECFRPRRPEQFPATAAWRRVMGELDSCLICRPGAK